MKEVRPDTSDALTAERNQHAKLGRCCSKAAIDKIFLAALQ